MCRLVSHQLKIALCAACLQRSKFVHIQSCCTSLSTAAAVSEMAQVEVSQPVSLPRHAMEESDKP